MSLPVSSADPTRCPLCGGVNACASALERITGQAQPPCWCMTAAISAEVLARVPPQARGQACVCQRCATLVLPSGPATEG